MEELKGNAIVGQSGGCTAVINCSLLGVIQAAKKTDGIEKLFGVWNGVAGLLNEDFTDLLAQDEATLEKLYHTPSAALGSCRHKLNADEIDRVLEVLKKHHIRYFYMIGGNDTADSSLRIFEKAKETGYEIRVIAIPKTIDNDLPLTDHCPGYGSVARFIAEVTQEVGLDTKAMKQVDPFKIIEVMGRNSGWIVAASALGKKSEEDPPHLMYFPEKPFDKSRFLSDVEEAYNQFGYVIIVISETIKDEEGNKIGEKNSGVTNDSFGHGYVEGTANVLCQWIEERFGKRARFDKPGTIQRMSLPYISTVDQEEAFLLGQYAVEISIEGKSGLMVIMLREEKDVYSIKFSAVSIDSIANLEKHLPENFMNEKGNFVTDDFIEYARPLIGSDFPEFAKIKNIKKIDSALEM